MAMVSPPEEPKSKAKELGKKLKLPFREVKEKLKQSDCLSGAGVLLDHKKSASASQPFVDQEMLTSWQARDWQVLEPGWIPLSLDALSTPHDTPLTPCAVQSPAPP